MTCLRLDGSCAITREGVNAYRHIDFPKHLRTLVCIHQCNVLRRGDNHSTWPKRNKAKYLLILQGKLASNMTLFTCSNGLYTAWPIHTSLTQASSLSCLWPLASEETADWAAQPEHCNLFIQTCTCWWDTHGASHPEVRGLIGTPEKKWGLPLGVLSANTKDAMESWSYTERQEGTLTGQGSGECDV